MAEAKALPNILQRLNAVRALLSYIQKDQKKIDGMYTATRYDDIVESAHDFLVANGVMVVVEALPDWEVVTTDQKTVKGIPYTRWQGRIQTTWYNVDDPKDFIVSSAPAFGLDQGDKGPGKGHTYGAKSNLVKTLFLVTGDESEEERAESAAASAAVSIGKERLDHFSKSINQATTYDEVKAAGTLAVEFIMANGNNLEDLALVRAVGSKRIGAIKTAKDKAKDEAKDEAKT